jgi:hypothetical protein
MILDIFPRTANHYMDSAIVHKIIITPDLNFFSAQESSERICTIELRNLIPFINGNTENSTDFFWEYLPFEDKSVIDYRFGYALVMKPKEAKSIILTVNVSAIVNTPYGEFKAVMKEKDKQSIQSTICLEYLEVI